MYYVIDQIENGIVVCQNLSNDKYYNISIEHFPENIKEGDVLFYKDGQYYIDLNKTQERKEVIKNKFNSLWNN